MEERYLYKAKRTDNREWVVWNIFSGLYGVDIDKSTVCRCTGAKDKNGKLIWENDIAKDEYGNFCKAFWRNSRNQFSWICVKSDVFSIGTKWDLWNFSLPGIEIVGNVFDNPELLEE